MLQEQGNVIKQITYVASHHTYLFVGTHDKHVKREYLYNFWVDAWLLFQLKLIFSAVYSDVLGYLLLGVH